MENQEPENEKPNETNSAKITMRKSTFNKLIIGVICASIVSAFLGGYVLGAETVEPEKIIITNAEDIVGSAQTQQSPQNQLSTSSSSVISISLDDDPVKGNPNAPITILEFSDFQCPFCAKFHSTTLPQIQTNYIDSGKVKFVYRDFPIQNIHPNAVAAAIASECADEQGMFWEYHDMVFKNQKNWQGLDVSNAVNRFEQFASDLDLDTGKFNNCLESAKYLDEVKNDLSDGRSYGVTGTPAFFIGNEKIGYVKVFGAQPYSVFQRAIDQQLAN